MNESEMMHYPRELETKLGCERMSACDNIIVWEVSTNEHLFLMDVSLSMRHT